MHAITMHVLYAILTLTHVHWGLFLADYRTADYIKQSCCGCFHVLLIWLNSYYI